MRSALSRRHSLRLEMLETRCVLSPLGTLNVLGSVPAFHVQLESSLVTPLASVGATAQLRSVTNPVALAASAHLQARVEAFSGDVPSQVIDTRPTPPLPIAATTRVTLNEPAVSAQEPTTVPTSPLVQVAITVKLPVTTPETPETPLPVTTPPVAVPGPVQTTGDVVPSIVSTETTVTSPARSLLTPTGSTVAPTSSSVEQSSRLEARQTTTSVARTETARPDAAAVSLSGVLPNRDAAAATQPQLIGATAAAVVAPTLTVPAPTLTVPLPARLDETAGAIVPALVAEPAEISDIAAVPGPAATGDIAQAIREETRLPAAESADVATETNLAAGSMGQSLEQLLGQLGDLDGSLRDYGYWPWLALGLCLAGISSEVARRLQRTRLSLGAASAREETPLEWFPGLYGPEE